MSNPQEEKCRAEVERMMQDLIKAGIPNRTLMDMVLEIREEANGDLTEILRKVRQLHAPVVELNRLTDEMVAAGANPQKLSEKIKEIQAAAGENHKMMMAGIRKLHQRVINYTSN